MMTHLGKRQQEALAAALQAHDEEIAAREHATGALKAAMAAGVPVTQLSAATEIPRMTLLRRVGKVASRRRGGTDK
jgi:hypothetical protein